MRSFKIYGKWSVQASNQVNIHTHVRNEVTPVWGSLRLAPINRCYESGLTVAGLYSGEVCFRQTPGMNDNLNHSYIAGVLPASSRFECEASPHQCSHSSSCSGWKIGSQARPTSANKGKVWWTAVSHQNADDTQPDVNLEIYASCELHKLSQKYSEVFLQLL